MGPLIVHCPKTRAVIKISTGIDTEYKSLARSWDQTIRIRCPHCNEEHKVKVRDAYIQGAVSDSNLRGA